MKKHNLTTKERKEATKQRKDRKAKRDFKRSFSQQCA